MPVVFQSIPAKISESERVLVTPDGPYTNRLLGSQIMSEQSTTAHVEYKDIPGFPGYRVGDDGSVWSRRGQGRRDATGVWKRLKPAAGRWTAHLHVGLCSGPHTKPVTKPVHRLVLLAFVGPCPQGMECCHNDGDPTNNALSNLRWDTRLANKADSARHGTATTGSKHGLAKLTEADVAHIRTAYAQGGVTQISLAKKYGVRHSAISRIISGKRWRHVAI